MPQAQPLSYPSLSPVGAFEGTTDPALLATETVNREAQFNGDHNGTDLVRTAILPPGAENVMIDIMAYTERAQKYANASIVANQNGSSDPSTSFFLNPNVTLRLQCLPLLDNLVGQTIRYCTQ